jgi:hypothetical protein
VVNEKKKETGEINVEVTWEVKVVENEEVSLILIRYFFFKGGRVL